MEHFAYPVWVAVVSANERRDAVRRDLAGVFNDNKRRSMQAVAIDRSQRASRVRLQELVTPFARQRTFREAVRQRGLANRVLEPRGMDMRHRR